MHLRLLAVPLMMTLGAVACGGGSQPAPAPAVNRRRRDSARRSIRRLQRPLQAR